MADQFVPVDASKTYTPKHISATQAAIGIGRLQGAWARVEGTRVRYGAAPMIFGAECGWLPNDNEANMNAIVEAWIEANDIGD